MASQSEVSTRLTADNSQYRSVMNQSERVAEQAGKSIFKKLDIKAGMFAIAAAVGFNLQNIAENLARFIIGYSKSTEAALEEMVKQTEKAAEAQERALEKARARKEKADNETSERLQRQDALVREQRIAAIDDERERNKTAAEERANQLAEISRLDAQAAEDKLSSAQKLAKWRTEEAAISKEIARLEKIGGDRSNEQNQFLVELKREQVDLQGKIKGAVDQTAKAESAVTGEINKQIEAKQRFYAITGTGRGDRELSDKELERKISNIQQDIFQRSINGGGGDIGSNLLLESQRGNLSQARSELDFRRRVRQQAGSFGEDFAFQRNPGLTEQRLQEILNGQDKSAQGRIAASLEKLEKQFQQGVPTVLFGSE